MRSTLRFRLRCIAPIQARNKRWARRGPPTRRIRGKLSASSAKSQQAPDKRQIARSEDMKMRLGWPKLPKTIRQTAQPKFKIYAKNARKGSLRLRRFSQLLAASCWLGHEARIRNRPPQLAGGLGGEGAAHLVAHHGYHAGVKTRTKASVERRLGPAVHAVAGLVFLNA